MFNSVAEAIFSHAETRPDALCLADDASRVTYREYADRIARYAARLEAMGVRPGDRVVIEACQSIDYLAIQQALQLIGGVFVPVEHNCASAKLERFATRSGAAAVIACAEQSVGALSAITFDRLAEGLDGVAPRVPDAFPDGDTVCEILFSTGTTGKEKGIVLTHANDIALAENVIHGVEMPADNVEMIPSPMNHSHGLRRYYANMVNGSAVVVLGSAMDMRRFFGNLDAYGVNAIDLVPAALTAVLRLSRGRLADYRDRLGYIQFGAAPMMDADRREICRLLPNTRLYNFYGSTESGCIALYNFNRPDAKPNCVGKPTRNADIFIVDDARRRIASDAAHPGLLASAGPMNMSGYWQDQEETARALENGAVYSNDEAYFDADGDIILLGRRGDVINVGGSKVSPEEIEDAARRFPGVADCGVIPVPDPYKGSVPKLFVQLRGGEPDLAGLRAFLTGQLEPYKVPARIEVIPTIPRSYNGKLLRNALKDREGGDR